MSLWRDQRRFQFLVDVRTSHPGVGMGLRFVEAECPEELVLLIQELELLEPTNLGTSGTRTLGV